MNRREFLIFGGASLVAGRAGAESPSDAVVRQLRGYGYREIEVGRTLLGRVRITAERGDVTREIVLEPRTGEVLRDLSRSGRMPILNGPKDGSEPGDFSSGDDDDLDDDRDDDRGDDGGDSDGGSDSGGDSDGGDDGGDDD